MLSKPHNDLQEIVIWLTVLVFGPTDYRSCKHSTYYHLCNHMPLPHFCDLHMLSCSMIMKFWDVLWLFDLALESVAIERKHEYMMVLRAGWCELMLHISFLSVLSLIVVSNPLFAEHVFHDSHPTCLHSFSLSLPPCLPLQVSEREGAPFAAP